MLRFNDDIPLLPTPNARDWKGSPGKGSRARGGHQASLPAAIAELLGIELEGEDECDLCGRPDEDLVLVDDGIRSCRPCILSTLSDYHEDDSQGTLW